MRPPAIPPKLEPAVLEKAGEGLSSRAISAWLLDEHGVTASYKAVSRLLERTRDERADVAKVVVRERLQKELPSDLDELEALRVRARGIEDAAKGNPDAADPEARRGNPGLALKAIEAQRRVLDTKLHYSGADSPDTVEQAGPAAIIVLPAPTEE